jgi:glycerophosphoryl diester phosphodiesterase
MKTGRAGWIVEQPIAHRGYHDMNRTIWENTPTAFLRAVDAGFAIECDVQLSADNVAMVFHDYTTDRLCGLHMTVRRRMSEEIGQLKVGTSSDSIPTLAAVLQQVHGRVGLVVEVKPQTTGDAEAIAMSVLTAAEGYKGKLALMSFDQLIVKHLIEAGSPWPVGLTAENPEGRYSDANERALDLDIEFVSFSVTDLPDPFIDKVRAKGLPVITWTVRNQEALHKTRDHADQMTFEGFDPRDPESEVPHQTGH